MTSSDEDERLFSDQLQAEDTLTRLRDSIRLCEEHEVPLDLDKNEREILTQISREKGVHGFIIPVTTNSFPIDAEASDSVPLLTPVEIIQPLYTNDELPLLTPEPPHLENTSSLKRKQNYNESDPEFWDPEVIPSTVEPPRPIELPIDITPAKKRRRTIGSKSTPRPVKNDSARKRTSKLDSDPGPCIDTPDGKVIFTQTGSAWRRQKNQMDFLATQLSLERAARERLEETHTQAIEDLKAQLAQVTRQTSRSGNRESSSFQDNSE